MNVRTTFLNRNLEEEVYMTQLKGFISNGRANQVCKLKKSIYGLKQALRSWNIYFDETIKSFGFINNINESCVFKKISGSTIIFLILYVDNILLIRNNVLMLQSVKTWLSQKSSMKDLDEASYILGIKIYGDRSKRILALLQFRYIDFMLKGFNMNRCKRVYLFMSHDIHLSKKISPKTPEERENKHNSLCFDCGIYYICYAMYQAWCRLCSRHNK